MAVLCVGIVLRSGNVQQSYFRTDPQLVQNYAYFVKNFQSWKVLAKTGLNGVFRFTFRKTPNTKTRREWPFPRIETLKEEKFRLPHLLRDNAH